ncbi:MAG TPA: Holliday junction resolvase RuvX [Armatimonadetes bacterium]|nr:Holliday junction resolvase RuvX [Armatimonadota bacterium]
MRVLAVDYGTKRVGLALSDLLEITANPLTVLPRKRGDREVIEAIARIVEEEAVEEVVVGLPVNMDGSHGPAAAAAEAFAAKLAACLKVPVFTHDERLTSEEAEGILISEGVQRSRRRGRVDPIAAALILRSYLGSPERLARQRSDKRGEEGA